MSFLRSNHENVTVRWLRPPPTCDLHHGPCDEKAACAAQMSSRSAAREGPNVSWAEKTVVTPLGRALGLHTENQQFRLYRATLQAIVDGMVLGRGRHGVVMALSNDPADPKFRLAVKIVHKYFTPSKGKEPSFHRAVAHTLHLQNEVAAMAKLSAENTFLLPLYCAFQDDLYVYIVCERGCCTLKQLIQHSHEDELQQLLAFQQAPKPGPNLTLTRTRTRTLALP